MNRMVALWGGRLGVALIVCLVLGMPGLASSAGLPLPPAAPVPQGGGVVADHFHFSLSDPGRMCVGRSYPLKGTLLVDVVGSGSSTFQAADRVVPGIAITAHLDAPGVATVSPASLTSGALQTDLLASPPFGNANGQGEVTFSLHAVKAGLANVIVQATIPGVLTGGAAQTIQVERPIQVGNCKYRVTLNGSWSRSYPNLHTTLTERLTGEMTGSEDASQLSGSADVSWSLRSFSVSCSHAHTIALSTATLTGAQANENMNLKIAYAAFPLETVNCGSDTAGQIPVQTISISGLPTTGDTIGGLSVSFPVGNEDLLGTATLTIVPIPLP